MHQQKNSGSLLVNNKDKLDLFKRSGVYKIFCSVCDSFYIVQTGRPIEKRIDEHKRSIVLNKPNTGFSEQCITHNHFLDRRKTEIVHSGSKGKKLDTLSLGNFDSKKQEFTYL
ncbi:hypothetical protein WA026_007363 [Henosepilachna vigintioctopunctata]|uniref:GIY-YIG domain-containing protein n=1 Tax=Henosepilachna vigintioctopunctata TaxID=420089 RepID=A0AAW1UXH0_9CUCU